LHFTVILINLTYKIIYWIGGSRSRIRNVPPGQPRFSIQRFLVNHLSPISKEWPLNIYVGNLPRTATDEDVRKLFESHGEVSQVKLIKDNFTGELRGFGFVEMPNSTEAQAAIKANDGTEMEGRKLIVNEARPKTDRPSGGGGGGGRPRSGGGGGGGGFRESRPRRW
jgi:RNA recognition motif-containing protein